MTLTLRPWRALVLALAYYGGCTAIDHRSGARSWAESALAVAEICTLSALSTAVFFAAMCWACGCFDREERP